MQKPKAGFSPALKTAPLQSENVSHRVLKKTRLAGCLKTLRYKAPDNLYPPPTGRGMRRTVQYVAVRRNESNAVDGRF